MIEKRAGLMNKFFTKFCAILCLNIAANANPVESEEAVHDTAHAAGSFAVNHLLYAGCNSVVGKKNLCLLSSVATTFGLGLLKEKLDGPKDNHLKGIIFNSIGLGSSITLIKLSY